MYSDMVSNIQYRRTMHAYVMCALQVVMGTVLSHVSCAQILPVNRAGHESGNCLYQVLSVKNQLGVITIVNAARGTESQTFLFTL